MITKARRAFIVLLAMLLSMGSALADTAIFVATDRHAKYETVGMDPPPREGDVPPGNGKKPPRQQQPLFDPDGNLIWHNHLTKVLELAAADGVQPEIVLLGGDNVGDGSDASIDVTGYPIGAPYFSMASVDAQVRYVFGEATRCLYTYGSHDIHATDPYESAFFTGPVEANGYYIYGISFAQMIYDTDQQAVEAGYAGKDAADRNGICAQAASQRFLTWVNSLADRLPIVVMSHVPLHANRGDNAGAWTWTQALNQASGQHDIVFLWGHNHTVEQRGSRRDTELSNYLKLPGEALTVQSWEAGDGGKRILRRDDGLVSREETLGFIYMNAGYITNGVGSLLTFSDANGNGRWDQLTVRRYALETEEPAPWTFALRE